MRRITHAGCATLGVLTALFLGLRPPGASAQLCTPEVKPLVVLLNSATRLQMLTRRNIRTVVNPKEGLLTIRTVERDPTTILLVGVAPGITRVELEDTDGNRETRDVVVQADVEYLTAQLRKAVPMSGITLIPNGVSSVILTGFVSRAEDIQTAQQIVQSVGFTAINGLRLNGVQQVQLDVVVARVRRTKARNFGFNFLQNSRNQFIGSTVGGIIPQPGSVGVGGAVGATALGGQNLNSSPGVANLFGGILHPNSGFLAFLQALENEGVAKLLAQPRLVTLSGNPASFLDGGEQAVPVPAGLGQVGVQFEEFGTRLNFLPIVLGNGRIHLEVEPEVSSLDSNAGVAIAGATVAGRATQRIHTTVEMETGQTFVIGGLIQKTTNGGANKVPVIGQLPFVGVAFSSKTYTDDESELIVMVTPHLVDPQSACQVSKVLPGQESRSPDDCELFLEGLIEAPRGPRAMFINGRYIPAHLSGPAAKLLPCAGSGDGLVKTPHGPLFSGGAACSTGGGCAPAAGRVVTEGPVVTPAAPLPAAPAAPAPVAAPMPEAVGVPPAALPPGPAEVKPYGGSLSAETPLPRVPGTLDVPRPPVSVPVAGRPN